MELTTTEVMLALMDGKKITAQEWDSDEYVVLRDEEFIDQAGEEIEFTFGGFTYELLDRTYAKGSFEWARVQHQNGAVEMESPSSGARMAAGRKFGEILFYGSALSLTDWQVAK